MHENAQGLRHDLEPGRHDGVDQVVLGLLEPQHAAGLLADVDDVVLGHAVGRDVGLLAVDREVAVGDQLAGLAAGAGQASSVNDVVQAGLQEDQQVVAGLAGKAVRLLVVAAELLLMTP